MPKTSLDAEGKSALHVLSAFQYDILGGLSGVTEAPKSYGNLIIDILVDFPEKINPKHQDILKALVPKSEPDLVDNTGTSV